MLTLEGTKMKLAKYPETVRYTLTEHNMFAALPKNGRRVGTADIAKVHGDEWNVQFPLKNITVTMTRLIGKVEANNEPFRIMKEDRYPGHNKVEYWLEEKPAARRKANGK
jgi:hypothetical protein